MKEKRRTRGNARGKVPLQLQVFNAPQDDRWHKTSTSTSCVLAMPRSKQPTSSVSHTSRRPGPAAGPIQGKARALLNCASFLALFLGAYALCLFAGKGLLVLHGALVHTSHPPATSHDSATSTGKSACPFHEIALLDI